MGIRKMPVTPDQVPSLGTMVRLDRGEITVAAFVGMMRHVNEMDTPDKHGLDGAGGIGWSLDIEAAAAEMAYAKARNLYWPGLVDDPKALPGDVGIAEIRQTANPEGHLLLHDDDHDDRPYVLVIGQTPEFRIVGWIWGRDGKQRHWWRADTGRPAYFIPQGALHEFAQLL